MIEVSALKDAIARGDASAVAAIIKRFNLTIVDGKITAGKVDLKEMSAYWDKRQLVTKISLNSLYGALLNSGCRFEDKRIGQSTTLTGRSIAKHMHSFINESIAGVYDHEGKAIIYGDSVTGDTLIRTDDGEVTIAALYNQCMQHERNGEKEYGLHCRAKVVGFNAEEDEPVMSSIAYVMRHKTKKKLYKITLQNEKTVTVTEDHSLMVDRHGFLLEVTPLDIRPDDLIICLNT